ncbi:hypothetical protein B0E52_08385 [Rhodanobacter sp. C06]|uniref:ankyrin repeat domain-containing protein n=1 Tax=Rhodanobacter sp. C06 TaxID=1945854 RepID=UPI000985767D|nr:ankyrin repeat domain-containing protein [Rhodanobacter sp. C06]OOG44396.1 hypothetical protein B0E52_08385 [Rhodanobacter sp. C06]
MLARLALIACALCALQSAIAAEPAPASSANLCRQALPTIRGLWQHDLYDAPPAVAAVMADAIDGKLPQVRQGLAALPAAEQAHWRQAAMLTAANAYQPAVVDGLLDDGAAVDEPVRLPPLKGSFYPQTVSAMAHDPRFGPGVAKGLQSAGVMNNHGNLVGPALPLAVVCGDTATLDVLLHHHANVMARAAPNVADALTAAVVNGDAPIVSRLLDHGADACADDRRIRKPGTTLASIGQRNHLPDALVLRLTCRAPATAAFH